MRTRYAVRTRAGSKSHREIFDKDERRNEERMQPMGGVQEGAADARAVNEGRQMRQEKELRGATDEYDMRWTHGPSGTGMGFTDEYDMRWTHGSSGTGMGLLLASSGAVTTAFDRGCMRAVRGWSRSQNRCKGRTHTDRQAAKREGRSFRRLETAVACPEACRWMGALVCSMICCRQFANCWVQLPVPGRPCWRWGMRGWARRLEDGRGARGRTTDRR